MTTEIPIPPFASMFAKVEDVEDPSSMLLYGPAGKRKTSTAGTILDVPKYKDAKVLILDIDRGTNALANNPVTREAIRTGQVQIIQMDKRKVNETHGMLEYFLGKRGPNGEFIEGEAFNPAWGYDIVWFDTLDVAQQVSVDWLMLNTFNEKDKIDTRAAWGEVNRWTNDVMWAFQNNTHSLGIIVMHSESGTDDSGKFSIKPKLQGGAKDNIASIPDLVAYLDLEADPNDKNKVQLVATIGGSSIITSKNRGMLPDRVVDFTLPAFYQMLEERRESHKNPAVKAA